MATAAALTAAYTVGNAHHLTVESRTKRRLQGVIRARPVLPMDLRFASHSTT